MCVFLYEFAYNKHEGSSSSSALLQMLMLLLTVYPSLLSLSIKWFDFAVISLWTQVAVRFQKPLVDGHSIKLLGQQCQVISVTFDCMLRASEGLFIDYIQKARTIILQLRNSLMDRTRHFPYVRLRQYILMSYHHVFYSTVYERG